MRSSLFFMFFTYKQKSQRSPKPDSSSPLEIHLCCPGERKGALQSPEKPSHKADRGSLGLWTTWEKKHPVVSKKLELYFMVGHISLSVLKAAPSPVQVQL